MVGGVVALQAVAANALAAMATLAMLDTMLKIPIKGHAVAVRLVVWEFAGARLTLLILMEQPAQPALRESTTPPREKPHL